MSYYTRIFDKYKHNPALAASKSQSWFTQQTRLLRAEKISPLKLIETDINRNRTPNRLIPGELYLFGYDAKLKDTLPYWDMYPMVFPFRKLQDGFLGLNMHYLPYQVRIALLDRLMEYKSNTRMDATTRLKFSWATIQQASKLQVAEACVHRYLYTHIRTQLKTINSGDWATALLMPVERFVGATKQRVWNNSLR